MQWACKPGSVSLRGPLAIYLRRLSPAVCGVRQWLNPYRSTLRLGRAALSRPYGLGRPQSALCRFTRTFNLRCAQHACRQAPGELLPHLLTLAVRCPIDGFFKQRNRWTVVGGYFLLHVPALANSYPLGSGVPCVARTFLSHKTCQRQAVPLLRCCKCSAFRGARKRKGRFFHAFTTANRQIRS